MNEKTIQAQDASVVTGKATEDANPMRKIILMVGVAIFIFLAFSTYNVKKIGGKR